MELQRYVNHRAKENYRGRKLSPTTLKKEIAVLRAAWNWAVRMELLHAEFPGKRLAYPKDDERLSFMTFKEIEHLVEKGGLSQYQIKEHWACLFLTLPEVTELLEHVRKSAAHAWIYPLTCFAAHTGARRSEIIGALRTDIDLEAGTVNIREKKRVKGSRSTRRVPLSPLLAGVLQDWLARHPQGLYLFGHVGPVAPARSSAQRRATRAAQQDRPRGASV